MALEIVTRFKNSRQLLRRLGRFYGQHTGCERYRRIVRDYEDEEESTEVHHSDTSPRNANEGQIF